MGTERRPEPEAIRARECGASVRRGVSAATVAEQAQRVSELLDSGYRALGGVQGGWIAQFQPQLNQVWTNPLAHRTSVKSALPEEFIHAVTMGFRPAQLYPLTNYLSGRRMLPGVEEFRDVVETVYFSAWPIVQERPVLARSLPRVHPSEAPERVRVRALAKRVLRQARRIAASAGPELGLEEARVGGLWAVMMFLLYVVPAVPGQCDSVLKLIDTLDVPRGWTSYGEVFHHFLKSADTRLKEPSKERLFLLAAPNEPHRDVAIMLDVVASVIEREPDDNLALFPTVLMTATLDTTGFTPLIWLKHSDDVVFAGIELWDQTSHKVEARRSVIEGRRALYKARDSAVTNCPVERFYRATVGTLADFFAQKGPKRPARVLELALSGLAERIDQHLMAVWRDANTGCPWCQGILRRDAVRTTVERILATPKVRIEQACRRMDDYERWLASTGLEVIRIKLHDTVGADVPVRLARPSEDLPPILWRGFGRSSRT